MTTVGKVSSGQMDSKEPIQPFQLNPTHSDTSSDALVQSTIDNMDTLSLAEKDRSCLLNIFPEEVWLLVFQEVDDFDDLKNLSNSSPYIRELLFPQRTKFLFGNVCQLLGKQLECHQEFIHDSETSGLQENNVNEATVIAWCQEFLNLRLVCRAWAEAVDDFFQKHPLHFDKINKNENEIVSNFLTTNTWLLSTSDLAAGKMLHHFAETHQKTTKNPFVGRIIEISITEREDEDEFDFDNSILSVLREYGEHFWYSTIEFQSFQLKRDCYLKIEKVLQLLPNLKVLKVYMQGVGPESTASATELEGLHAEISLHPLPTLKKLQMLITRDLLPSVVRELLRSSCHINTLIAHTKDSRYRNTLSEVALTDLKKLEISFYYEAEFQGIGNDPVMWPLTELNLKLDDSSHFIDWQLVFDVIEKKFKNTLKKLNLSLPVAVNKADKYWIDRVGHTFKLNLPHLTSLWIKMNNLACLDFILPSRLSVTDLRISVNLKKQENIIQSMENLESGDTRILKLLSCVRCPFNTNVWVLFPNLMKVGYKVSTSKLLIECESENKNSWAIRKKDK